MDVIIIVSCCSVLYLHICVCPRYIGVSIPNPVSRIAEVCPTTHTWYRVVVNIHTHIHNYPFRRCTARDTLPIHKSTDTPSIPFSLSHFLPGTNPTDVLHTRAKKRRRVLNVEMEVVSRVEEGKIQVHYDKMRPKSVPNKYEEI